MPGEEAIPAQPPAAAQPAAASEAPVAPQASAPIGPQLGPYSRVVDLKARLHELKKPIYGTQAMLWQRLVAAENEQKQLRGAEEFLRRRTEVEDVAATNASFDPTVSQRT